MRIVALVGAFVACVHAGFWALSREQANAPNFDGQLASVSYTPFDGSAHPDSGKRTDARADPRRPQGHRALHADGPHLFRRPAAPSWCRRSPTNSACGPRSAPGSTRTRSRNERELRAVIDLARQRPQHRQHRGRQRNDLPRRADRRRADQDDPARQARDLAPGHHRRNLARLDRASRARLGGRFHRRARAALLGRHLREGRGRPHDHDLQQAAPGLSRQAHRDRRIRLAERGLQPPRRQSRPASRRPRCCATSSAAPKRSASTTTSSKPTTSRGRRSKAASAPTGACSTPRASRSSPWTGPITNPDHWKLASLAVLIGVLLSLPILTLAGATVGQAALLAAAAHVVGALVRDRVRLLERTLLRARRGLRVRARPAAAGPADPDRARPHRGDRRGRVRPQAAPADRVAAARARSAVRAQGLDPHPGLYGAAGDAQGDARCRGAARLPELRVRRRHQQHARSGALAAGRGALPHARRALQVRARGQSRRASRPARCGWRSRTPRPTPRSSACSTPTTWCMPTGSRTSCRCSPIRRSAWCRRRRITATASAA